MTMFAMPVDLGREAEAAEEINASAGGKLAFVPKAEIKLGRESKFEYVQQPMLPGFVLLDVVDASTARRACRRARGLSEIVPKDARMVELSSCEQSLISMLASCGEAPFSEGVIRGGRLLVESGALAHRERLIGHVSHRRKRAFVPATVGGNPVELELGLRVVRQGGEA